MAKAKPSNGPSNLHRISARVPEALKEEIEIYALRCKRRFSFLGRQLSTEGLVAAVLLEYLGMPADRQREVLQRRLREVEEMFCYEPGAHGAGDDFVTPDPPPSAGPRRKANGA